MNKIKILIQIIILFPIVILLIFIRPIMKIRVGRIESKLIGHMTIQQEIFLCEKEEGLYDKEREKIVWFHDKEICNHYILNHWKKKMIVLPGYILYPLEVFFNKFNFTKKFYLNSRNKKKDHHKLLLKYDPFIKFSNQEILNGDQILAKNNIEKNDRIVCFASRSKFYKNENFESSRNSSINNQVDSIKFLLDKGFKAVRVGRSEQEKLKLKDNRVFDYSFSPDKNDFYDLYIISRCSFMISNESGVNEMATIMRIPKLIINYFLFENLKNVNDHLTPIILPKKIQSIKDNKIITYEDAFKLDIFSINTVEELKKKGFCLIENTKEEISNAVSEMYELIINKNLNLEMNFNKQLNFWNKYQKYYNYIPEKIIISPKFFDLNENLF